MCEAVGGLTNVFVKALVKERASAREDVPVRTRASIRVEQKYFATLAFRHESRVLCQPGQFANRVEGRGAMKIEKPNGVIPLKHEQLWPKTCELSIFAPISDAHTGH